MLLDTLPPDDRDLAIMHADSADMVGALAAEDAEPVSDDAEEDAQ